MISKEIFFERIEKVLHGSRIFDEKICSDFFDLSKEHQYAFARLLSFIGCKNTTIFDCFSIEKVEEKDRIIAVRFMLMYLFVDSGNPRWSSLIIERMIEVVIGTPGGAISDIFEALFDLLKDVSDISGTLANFLKEIVIKCYSKYRQSYELIEFSSFIHLSNKKLSKAQAYLALYSLPEDQINKFKDNILEVLSDTPFIIEAKQNLNND